MATVFSCVSVKGAPRRHGADEAKTASRKLRGKVQPTSRPPGFPPGREASQTRTARLLAASEPGRTATRCAKWYWDFGPTLAAEKLREIHGITLGHETLRLWMIEAGLWRVRRWRKKDATSGGFCTDIPRAYGSQMHPGAS
jgi:hypothetical protein